MARKKQSYNKRLDEKLSAEKNGGKISNLDLKGTRKQKQAKRRKISKATRKPKGSYGFTKKKKS